MLCHKYHKKGHIESTCKTTQQTKGQEKLIDQPALMNNSTNHIASVVKYFHDFHEFHIDHVELVL